MAEPEPALSELALLIPLMRVRVRSRKSYIPGTIIGTADRYLVSVGMHTLLMGEYLRLSTAVSLIGIVVGVSPHQRAWQRYKSS